jgi:hypothetical protein
MDGLIMVEYARQGHPTADLPIGLQAAHWAHIPQYIPPSTVKVNPSWQCKVCSNKRIMSITRWECDVCNVPHPHVPECFKIYHIKKNYQVNYCYKYIIFLK